MALHAAVIGARGQLGSDLCAQAPSHASVLPLTSREIDVTSRPSVREVLSSLKPALVINTAAYVRVDDAEDHEEEAFRVNALGPRYLAESCSLLGAGLIHISTDYVFDGMKENLPYMEDDAAGPLNTYGLSKLAGELFIRNTHEKHHVIRTASLYGATGSRGKGGSFVKTVIEKARRSEEITAAGDIVMSPTSTSDLARWIWSFAAQGREPGIYHAVNGGWCSWYDFACAVAKEASPGARIIAVSHGDLGRRARRPLRTPLGSLRGSMMRPWQEALAEFLRER
ncbi:MAG: dTDP-4-dehydrorhamnose reductase [Candidatus Eremiobacteraeota bacterium]|nr:dTDP-4-dehydrorhamnose reductase [Candidatus Eremiobacteraeota bacterium]